jgi:hypothetical protein
MTEQGEETMIHDVISAVYKEDYKIEIEFDNGEKGVMDFSNNPLPDWMEAEKSNKPLKPSAKNDTLAGKFVSNAK